MGAGMLIGILISGVQVAISASNTGGAWDNAKKEVEAAPKEPLKCNDANKECKDPVGPEVKESSPEYKEYKKRLDNFALFKWQVYLQKVKIADGEERHQEN